MVDIKTKDFLRLIVADAKEHFVPDPLIERKELTIINAEYLMNSFVRVMTRELLAGKSIEINDFALFESVDVPEMMRRNPHTGEMFKCPATRKPSCKFRKHMKESLKYGYDTNEEDDEF